MSQIFVERDGDSRISLTGWVGPSTPSKCKAIGGGRFRPKTAERDAHWSYPLSLSVCRAMRAQFGEALVIGRALSRWAHEEKKRESVLSELSLSETAVLSRVPALAPTLDAATQTRPYQRVAAAWGAATGSFLLADQQGLGKSIETLATIVEGSNKGWHLIFSPSVAVDTVWSAEVRRWLKDMRIVVVPLTGSLKQRQETLATLDVPWETEHVFVVTNIEAARIKPSYDEAKDPDHRKPQFLAENAVLPALHSRIWDTVVVDECQRALIRTSGKPTQARAGFNLISKNSRRRIALSGTPMRGKPEQLWGTLHWLRPDVYTSYWNWVKRYFSLTSNGFSNYLLNGFLPGGEMRLADDLKSIMLRRTKAEVLSELPPKTYAGTYLDPNDLGGPCGVWLEPTPAQRKQIAEFERDGLLDFGDAGEILVDGVLAEYTRRKQLANAVHELRGGSLVPTLDSPKYRWLLDWLSEADGEKIVVASQFTQIIDVFAAGLRAEGYKVSVLTGKTSAKERARMVEQFQTTDEVQVFMLNTKAGGVALTLDSADYLVLLDETTVPDDQEQVEDRIHRTSRIHNVTIYYLRTLGTLDEEISWIAAARANVQAYLMDGARGVEYAKRVYSESKINNKESK